MGKGVKGSSFPGRSKAQSLARYTGSRAQSPIEGRAAFARNATHHFVVAYYVPAGRAPLRMLFSLMLKRTGCRRIATEEWSLPYLNAILVGGTAARIRSVCGSPYLLPIFASWREIFCPLWRLHACVSKSCNLQQLSDGLKCSQSRLAPAEDDGRRSRSLLTFPPQKDGSAKYET